MKRVYLVLRYTMIVLTIIILTNCGDASNQKEFKTFDPKYESQVDSIVKNLSLEEKIALLHGNSFFSSEGIPRLGITEMKYTDGPLGVREEMNRNDWGGAGWTNDSALFFPAGSALAATWNPKLARRYGEAMGEQTRARGKDIILAPAINIIRTPLCGRNYEYLSEDPFLNVQITSPLIKGIQISDVGVSVKHYAINNQEKNREHADVYASERAIREIYLPGFKAAVDAGAYTFMGAYNKFRGHNLCENDYLVNQVLKEEWGFQGYVLSDWSAVKSTVNSALHGLDVEMGSGSQYDSFYFAQPLLKAVQDGLVPEEIIDEKAARIVRVMLNLKKNDSTRLKGSLNTPEQSQIIYDVASEAIVLLKNEHKILPLDINKIKSIAVIGENAVRKHGAGVFGAGVKAKYETSPMEGFKSRFGDKVDIKYTQGYEEKYHYDAAIFWKHLMDIDYRPNDSLMAEAVSLAKTSDLALLVLGSTRNVESEGADRKSLKLPFGQEELIQAVVEANPNTVVIFVGGGPFDLNNTQKICPAIVWAWFNGSETGNALADVIIGKINPSGKLPFTFPVKLEDSPAHALGTYPGGDSIIYKEDIFVGYRWFDTKDIDPLYPFGFGLSYTSFEYTDLNTDKQEYKTGDIIETTLFVENTGDLKGKEIIQLYVKKLNSNVERPEKELKGFTKTELNSGQKGKVKININVEDLAYYSEEEMKWVVEEGEYEIFAGSSSRDIRSSVVIKVNN